ncbi:hypothetical protein ACIP6I_10100 [Streptomyces anulatus]
MEVEHLSKDRAAPTVWLWSSKTSADDADVDRAWQAFLRRFDLEHTFRLFKQTLGWTRPRLREPEAADRWTWLIIAAYTQLRLARPITHDLRPPGRSQPHRTGSHPPASDGRFGTSTSTCPAPPEHQNPTAPGPDDHTAPRTDTEHPATTWAKPSAAKRPLSLYNGRKVKEQAECVFLNLS